jgi:hypothetical protein
MYALILTKNGLGYNLGDSFHKLVCSQFIFFSDFGQQFCRFFHKLVWSPCFQPVWSCGHDPTGGKLYPDRPTCTGSTNVLLYAWARDAKKIDLPDGVGFEVGGKTSRWLSYQKFQILNYKYL